MNKASAYANANIALVKYWGKSDSGVNIPAVSSLSMTLDDFGCHVDVAPCDHAHEVSINGEQASPSTTTRTASFLEAIRSRFAYAGFFNVASKTSVPVAAGLASSAAYFASLTKAIDGALNLSLDDRILSTIARMGSGSAARSIFGGFAALHGGDHVKDDDAFAYPVAVHDDLKLHLIVAVVDDQEKPISSREAMKASKATSPFFAAFVDGHQHDMQQAIHALANNSFASLGEAMEHSTLKMFATMWTARPAIMFWQPKSLAIIEAIHRLRKDFGPIAYFTMDAGPNVKILCEEKNLPLVLRTIAAMGITKNILCTKPGKGAVFTSSRRCAEILGSMPEDGK